MQGLHESERHATGGKNGSTQPNSNEPSGAMIQAWEAATGKPAWQVDLKVHSNRIGDIGGASLALAGLRAPRLREPGAGQWTGLLAQRGQRGSLLLGAREMNRRSEGQYLPGIQNR